MSHLFIGQKCMILWLEKRDVLKPLLNSYSVDSHQQSWKFVVFTNIYLIIMNCNGSPTNAHSFHCMLLSTALLLLVKGVMFFPSCYPPCSFFRVHSQCNVVTYTTPLSIFIVLAYYYHF
jgi:hypothetical protein